MSTFYPTLKTHNFFAIGPILIILDVPKSSWSVFFHSHTYFPGRFRESSSNLGLVFLILRWIRFSSILMFFRKVQFSQLSIIIEIYKSVFLYEKIDIIAIRFVFRIRTLLEPRYSPVTTPGILSVIYRDIAIYTIRSYFSLG